MRLKTYLISLFFLVSVNCFSQKFEAESATLSWGAEKLAGTTESGGFYVGQKEGNLTFNLNLTEGGTFNIYIQVAAPYGDKVNHFIIDGLSVDFSTPTNTSYTKPKVVSFLKLAAGAHKVEITKFWGWINIDYIEFEKVDASTQFNINKTLVTPNPTDETVKLYQFLLDNYQKKIISGVSEMTEVDWLKTNTGKSPVLVGLDFLFCGRGYTSWYDENIPFNQGRTWYEKNGIVAFQWHWRDPSRKTEFFYTQSAQPVDYTSFDISKVFDETSAEYKAMISDIDYISGQLKRFQDARVPIIWRPLHEAAGGWFWWGAKGAAPCKKLWQIMFDRMVNVNGLHNLIWVWTHQPNDEAWYPGDEYVDIVGCDIYKDGDHTSQILQFNETNNLVGGKKMVTISESGSFPDVDNLIKDAASWSWYMVWNGDFTRSSKYNSLDLWKKMFASDYVITLDEMPNLKTYVTGVEINQESTFSVFPTVFSEQINIQSAEPIQTVTIFNQLGMPVKQIKLQSNNAVISLSSLPSGMYLLKADAHDSVKIMKK